MMIRESGLLFGPPCICRLTSDSRTNHTSFQTIVEDFFIRSVGAKLCVHSPFNFA